jgi:DNA-binding transcriptional LysR family regulator
LRPIKNQQSGNAAVQMSESLRDLRLFVAAYEEGSFTAAAARENATQSGVSQHMHKLETVFGIKLFMRGAGSVTPTPAGHIYYRHCIEILRSFQISKDEMARFQRGLSGEIVVGLMPTLTRCALTPALASFVERHPNARVRVVEGYSAMLTDRVRSGEFAFAIVPKFQRAQGLKSRHLLSTPEVLVSRRESCLKHLEPVRLSALGPLNMVLPGNENTRRRTLETYMASNGVRIRSLIEIDAMMGTLDLVAKTDWVTILPGVMMASDIDRDEFTVNPIVEPGLTLDLSLIEPLRQPMDAIAQAFAELVESETARVNARWTKLLAFKEIGKPGSVVPVKEPPDVAVG